MSMTTPPTGENWQKETPQGVPERKKSDKEQKSKRSGDAALKRLQGTMPGKPPELPPAKAAPAVTSEAKTAQKVLGLRQEAGVSPKKEKETDKHILFLEKLVQQYGQSKMSNKEIAQAREQIELMTHKFTYGLHDEKLLKQVQGILEKTGKPSSALASHIRLLERQRTSLLAILPAEIQEMMMGLLDAKSLVNISEMDENLRAAGYRHSKELLEQIERGEAEATPQTRCRLALIAGNQVNNLDLQGFKDLSDEQLKELLESCPNLVHLNLTGCRNISEEGFKHFALTPQLKGLGLSDCWQITDNHLALLKPLSELETLNLSNCDEITSVGLNIVGGLTKLNWLSLSGCKNITDDGLVPLIRLQNLEHLFLEGCRKITDQGVDQITKMDALTTLSLNSIPSITGEAFRKLQNLPYLTFLSLAKCGDNLFMGPILQTAFESETPFRNLKVLDLSYNYIWRPDLIDGLEDRIYTLPLLEHLYVVGVTMPSKTSQSDFVWPALYAGITMMGPPWWFHIVPAGVGLLMGAAAVFDFSSDLPPSPRATLKIHTSL